MKSGEILEQLYKLMPKNYAVDWDNVGLLAGRSDKEVKKIFITLDVKSSSIDKAIAEGADLIITHHPLIFRGLHTVNDMDSVGRRLLRLIQHDISYIAMHTNFDVASCCMADICADKLGISEGAPLEVLQQEDGKELGIGKVGVLEKEISFDALAKRLQKEFALDSIDVYGMELGKKAFQKIAVSPGSGKGMYKYALKKGADILITGDITHHEGIDAAEDGMMIIDAGHYGLESVFIDDMEKKLQGVGEFEIIKEYQKSPRYTIVF